MPPNILLISDKEHRFTDLVTQACEKMQAQLSLFSLSELFEAKPKATDLMICNCGSYPAKDFHRHLIKTSPGCPVIIATDHYQHEENLLFAGLSDRYYLVSPKDVDDLVQYLGRFKRTKTNLLRRLQHLFDNELGQQMNETSIISMADTSGRITYVNQRFCDISGYQESELVGQNHRLLKSGYHADEFYRDMWHTIGAGHSWQGRVCNRRKDGSLYWVKSVIHPIKNTAGVPCLYLSIREDISREFAYEQQLIEKDETLHRCNSYGHTYPFEWTFADQTIRCNGDISALVGIDSPLYECTHQQLLQHLHPEDREENLNQLRLALNEEAHEFLVEARLIRADGSDYWLRQQGKIIFDEDQTPIKMLGVITDIQDLKTAQSSEREANQIKSNFISSLAHEIRNPVNAIFGYSQLIDKDPTATANRKRARQIGEVCQYISGMINDIGDLSLLENDTISVEPQPLSVADLVHRAHNIITPLLGDVTLELDENSSDYFVQADQQRSIQILVNLLSNAVKYNRAQGNIRLWTEASETCIRIKIEDTGEGIQEQDLERIFHPFERLQWQHSEVKGLGLGLPLSKKLAEKMQGKLGLESTLGQGTLAWLELPRTTVSITSPPIKTKQFDPLEQPAKIMLVEDDPFNQEFMADQITSLGHRLYQAHNGAQALEILQQQSVDLIITDCNMPEMDGLELCRALKNGRAPLNATTPLIATTALTDPDVLKTCSEAGIAEVLTKPVNLNALTDSISLHLATHKQQPATVALADSPPLDTIDIAALQNYVGDKPHLRTRLLRTYLELISTDLPSLLRAFHDQQLAIAQKLAHKLKPASITVGATALGELLHRIESMDLNDPGNIYEEVEHLRQSTGDIFDAVNTLIHNQRSSDHHAELPITSENNDLSVLIVDDSPFSIEHAEEVLKAHGIEETASAISVEQALKLLKQQSFDIILLDLNLPEIDGLQLIRLLSENHNQQHFIIYSTQTSLVNSAKDLIEQYHMSFLGHVNKPIMAEEIKHCLANFLRPKKSRSKRNASSIVSLGEVKEALTEGRLQVCYQPQVYTQNRELCSVEVLARLIDSNGDIIAPLDFIPQVEELKLHTLLGISVAKIAVEQLAEWIKVTPQLKMSINFSMAAFDDLDLPNKLLKICETHQVTTSQITIEVTESDITERPKISTEVLARLRLLGFTLSIDDFGTGYASLEKLQKYPFTELKLDKSYVSNARSRKVSLAIMKSSIDLAKQLKMLTVAEGVETLDDYQFAGEIGVDIVQGFYISKPVDANTIKSWLIPETIQQPERKK